ncbi:hypothetical protein AB0Q97_39190, partial [Streptomyces sp. NPDC088135]
ATTRWPATGIGLGAGTVQRKAGAEADPDARQEAHVHGLLAGRGQAIGSYTAPAATAQAPISVVRAAISRAWPHSGWR